MKALVTIRRACIAAVLAFSLTLLAVSAAFAAEPNNDVGQATDFVLGSTVTDTLSTNGGDKFDVYRVPMQAGKKYGFKLQPLGAPWDCDLVLLAPDASSVNSMPVYLSQNDKGLPDSFTYVSPQTGVFPLSVEIPQNAIYNGTYTLTVQEFDLEADDEIGAPDVELPPSAVQGTLDRFSDMDDVFSFYLEAGKSISIALTSPTPGTDFDAYLYHEGDSVYTSDPFAKFQGPAYPETGLFTATESDTYFLDLNAFYGAGAYTLAYEIGDLPTVTIAGPGVVGYAQSATLTGLVTTGTAPAPVANAQLKIQMLEYGSSTWKYAGDAVTNADGTFSATVAARPYKTRYRAQVVNTPGVISAYSANTVLVSPKVWLGSPYVPAKIAYGRAFTSWGTLLPRYPAGSRTVKIYAQRWQKTRTGNYGWVTRRILSPTNRTYYSTTRYSTRVVLPYRGVWRLYAVSLENPRHAATNSRVSRSFRVY